MSLPVVRTVSDLRHLVTEWRKTGEPVAIVPTMGALHEGHLSLVRAALERTSKVVVTIFVNPKQFNNASDLATYPKSEIEDAAKLSAVGASVLFAPDVTEMYPDGFSTTVSVSGVSEGLCGAARPGHFDGVATVVAKLFLQSGADIAFFGEKDYQQLQVIKRMVRDLDIQIDVVGCPIIREFDGLAMSSRNLLLSPTEREIAPQLASILSDAVERITTTADPDIGAILDEARSSILKSGFRNVDYLELRAAADLRPLDKFDQPARLLVAASLGSVRLIDNMPLDM